MVSSTIGAPVIVELYPLIGQLCQCLTAFHSAFFISNNATLSLSDGGTVTTTASASHRLVWYSFVFNVFIICF